MKNLKKVLILRFSSYGDVAIMIPVLRVLSVNYPNVTFKVASRSKMAPLFDEFSNIRFVPIDLENDYKGLTGIFKLFSFLKKLKPTHVADLHFVIRTRILSFLFKMRGYKVRSIDKGRIEKKALTRFKNKLFEPLTPTVFRYSKVFTSLGFPIDVTKAQIPHKNILPKKMEDIFYGDKKKWIGIAPFAKHQGKVYPHDLMQKVIALLQRDYNILLLGSGVKETKLLEVWSKAYLNCYNGSKELNFREQLMVLPFLDLMISMDSLNGHLASNAGIPVITVWGQTHPYAGFTPFGQPEKYSVCVDREKFPGIPTSIYGNFIPKGYEDAFRTIDPLTIIEKAIQIIEKNI
tara:strand:- start:8034 stop:9074 length:1041 start_codon:yes stop_codon:yes gene_type:complete